MMGYTEDWEWAFMVLGFDLKLGRTATAEDFTPFSPRQLTARKRAIKEAGNDPAVQAIYAQVPALQDMLGIDLHVDHIWPIAKGGKHVAENLQIVPKELNLRKNDKMPFKYDG